MKLTRFAAGSVQGFGKNKVAQTSLRGKYFWASSSNNNLDKWWSLSSWWTDITFTKQATSLPTVNMEAVILGSVVPYVDLDRQDWIQPQIINTQTTGITFYSTLSNTVSCDVNVITPGIVTFTNNSSFNY